MARPVRGLARGHTGSGPRPRRRPGWLRLGVPVIALAAVATAAAPGWLPYRVQRGDTLWGLARTHHTTVAALAAANHLTNSTIYAGSLLLLPGAGAGVTATRPAAVARSTVYLVRRGDTLSALARRFGTPMAVLARANRLAANLQIDVGQALVIPAVAESRPATAGPVSAVAVSVAPLTASASEIAGLVRATAVADGVNPRLALAVAWQESGFQQDVVSSSGAIGVMQLEPATARWLSGALGRPLNPARLTDNITGGVELLRMLMNVSTTRTAVASYYQGLGSVLAHGLTPDTRRYVADVFALEARFPG